MTTYPYHRYPTKEISLGHSLSPRTVSHKCHHPLLPMLVLPWMECSAW